MGRRRRLLVAAEQLAETCPGEARFLLWTLRSSRGNERGLERICPYCFQFLVPDSYRVRLKPKMKLTPQTEKVLKREAKNHKLNMKQTKLLRKYRESRSILIRVELQKGHLKGFVTQRVVGHWNRLRRGEVTAARLTGVQEALGQHSQFDDLVTCKSCNKTTRYYGKSRDFLAAKTQNCGTPGTKSSLKTPDVKIQSAKKMTPVSCSRSGSKGNSPSSLSRTRESGQITTNSASKTPRNSKLHFSKLKRMLDLEEKEKNQKADFKTFLTLL